MRLKFTPTGQVTISARMPVSDQHVLFAVADTGIGIPPEHHETIFKEFSQVENPLQERHRGTGLGLPLCRNLAMLLGGPSLAGKRRWERVPPSTWRFRPSISVKLWSGEDSAQLPGSGISSRARTDSGGQPQETAHVRIVIAAIQNSSLSWCVDIAQAEVWTARHVPRPLLRRYTSAKSSWGFIISLRDRFPNLPIILTSDQDEKQRGSGEGSQSLSAQARSSAICF